MALPSLFSEIMPYGGKLDKNNRWLKLSTLIPWKKLGELHDAYFQTKRLQTVKSSRLIIGLLIGKVKLSLSDREVVNYLYENPYFQYFCGFDNFITGESKIISPSLLTKRRNKLGAKYFNQFELEIIEILKQHKLIKGKEFLSDATVVESKIEYPNDVKLLNNVRKWAINKISTLKKTLNLDCKIRTYQRVAKNCYLNYAKRKKKTYKIIRSSTRKMLGFTARNIRQLETVLNQAKEYLSTESFKLTSQLTFIQEARVKGLIKEIAVKLKTAKEIHQQQDTKYQTKSNQINNRIVSFDQPYIRPIVRGKAGKRVEFGAKLNLISTEGYVLTNKIEHRAFSEKLELKSSIAQHQEIFKRNPKKALIDDGYSSLENKKLLKELNIPHSLKSQGRSTQKIKTQKNKFRKERSKIEGVIGNLKKDYSLAKIVLKTEEGAAIQTSLAMVSFNLFRRLRQMA